MNSNTHRETKISLVLGLTIANLLIWFRMARYMAPGADVMFGSCLSLAVLSWTAYIEVKELHERGGALLSSRIAKRLTTLLCNSLRNTGLLVWGILLGVGTLLSGLGFLTEPATIFSTAALGSLCFTAPRILEAGTHRTIDFSGDVMASFRDLGRPLVFESKPSVIACTTEHRPRGAMGLNLASPGECGDADGNGIHVYEHVFRNGPLPVGANVNWNDILRKIEAFERRLEAHGGWKQ